MTKERFSEIKDRALSAKGFDPNPNSRAVIQWSLGQIGYSRSAIELILNAREDIIELAEFVEALHVDMSE